MKVSSTRTVTPSEGDEGKSPRPLTPARVVLAHPALIVATIVAVVILAGLAAYHDGSVLLPVDEPIQRWVQDRRSGGLDTLFRFSSRMGSNVVIFSLAALLAALTWKRCRFVALAILAAAALRPGMEFVVKALIDRPRPDIGRLVPGTGPSHPSGHVLASIALYGMVPAVVLVFTGSRRAWAWTVGVVIAVVPFIAASRVYLGVHWFFDVTAGFLIGTLYLLAVEYLFRRYHPDDVCDHD
jgi:undecaprenyl-diphosphatase